MGVLQSPLDLGLFDSLPAQAKGDIGGDVEPRKAGVLLEYHADAVRYAAPDRPSLERHLARRGWSEGGDDVEQGRLAATGRTDHGKKFAPAKIEIDRSQRVGSATPGIVELGDATQ